MFQGAHTHLSRDIKGREGASVYVWTRAEDERLSPILYFPFFLLLLCWLVVFFSEKESSVRGDHKSSPSLSFWLVRGKEVGPLHA